MIHLYGFICRRRQLNYTDRLAFVPFRKETCVMTELQFNRSPEIYGK